MFSLDRVTISGARQTKRHCGLELSVLLKWRYNIYIYTCASFDPRLNILPDAAIGRTPLAAFHYSRFSSSGGLKIQKGEGKRCGMEMGATLA